MPDALIIGCGVNIHPVHRHGWTEVTVDIDAASGPTYTGDITDATFIGALSGIHAGQFDLVYFENIPANVFQEELTALVIMNAVDQLLAPNGAVRIRTGAMGEKAVAAMKKAFARWRYQRVYEGVREFAEVIRKHDLAAEDQGEAFDMVFQKIAGARRAAAEV